MVLFDLACLGSKPQREVRLEMESSSLSSHHANVHNTREGGTGEGDGEGTGTATHKVAQSSSSSSTSSQSGQARSQVTRMPPSWRNRPPPPPPPPPLFPDSMWSSLDRWLETHVVYSEVHTSNSQGLPETGACPLPSLYSDGSGAGPQPVWITLSLQQHFAFRHQPVLTAFTWSMPA